MTKNMLTAKLYFRRRKHRQKKTPSLWKRGLCCLFWCILLCFLFVKGSDILSEKSRNSRLHRHTAESDVYRRQRMGPEMLEFIKTTEDPGRFLGIYWLETNFSQEPFRYPCQKEVFQKLQKNWEGKPSWEAYCSACEAVWDDLVYFPVPEPSNGVPAEVTFEDSWMFERNYGGKRGHEGTDIMASVNERGLYPVVSMTDGVLLHKGWLEQGGYRLSITAPGGACFYYAHLDSYADINEGDTIKAGDLLGFMGDTGYSKIEGTTGNFPVHLHIGIYLVLDDREISYNPYYALRFLESRKMKCAYPN